MRIDFALGSKFENKEWEYSIPIEEVGAKIKKNENE